MIKLSLSEKNNVWFTSDHHWGHANIIKYESRPFGSIKEHDEALIWIWNKYIRPKDFVFHLGDFALSSVSYAAAIFDRLNGIKHIVWGNHDKITRKIKHLFAASDEVGQITVGDQLICISHYRPMIWNKRHHGSWALYGHSHGNSPAKYYVKENDQFVEVCDKSMDVGVDCAYDIWQEFRPFHFHEIKEMMDSKSAIRLDHH